MGIGRWSFSQKKKTCCNFGDRSRLAVDRNLRAHSSRSLVVAVAVPASSDTELVRRFIEELWNGRKLELADELIARDCQTHQLRSGAPLTAVARGPAAIKNMLPNGCAASSDLKVTIEQIFSFGDKVFTQSAAEGTHTATWLEVPATNKRVTIRMMMRTESRVWQKIGCWWNRSGSFNSWD